MNKEIKEDSILENVSMESKLRTIQEFYGYKTQFNQTIEELAELIMAIENYTAEFGVKSIKNGIFNEYAYNLFEELADVNVMMEHMNILLDCKKVIEEAKITYDNKDSKENNLFNSTVSASANTIVCLRKYLRELGSEEFITETNLYNPIVYNLFNALGKLEYWLELLIDSFECSEHVNSIKEQKINRQIKRIESGGKKYF